MKLDVYSSLPMLNGSGISKTRWRRSGRQLRPPWCLGLVHCYLSLNLYLGPHGDSLATVNRGGKGTGLLHVWAYMVCWHQQMQTAQLSASVRGGPESVLRRNFPSGQDITWTKFACLLCPKGERVCGMGQS